MVIVANDPAPDAQTLPSNGETAARPTVDLGALPSEPTQRVEALEHIVEQQAASLSARTRCTGCSCGSCSPVAPWPSSATPWPASSRGPRSSPPPTAGCSPSPATRPRSSAPGPWTASTAPVGSWSRASRSGRASRRPRQHAGLRQDRCGLIRPRPARGLFLDRPLTAADVHLLERAATVAALAITKEQAVAAVKGKYRAEFLRDALAGRAGEPADAVSHAASLGWDIARPMVVVVAETDENDEETTRSADEARSLQERFVRAGCRPGGRATPAGRSRLQPGSRRPGARRLRHRHGCRDAHRRRDRQGRAW